MKEPDSAADPQTKFPIVSDCPGCQANADARALFLEIEPILKPLDLDPMRVTQALSRVTGMWGSIAIGLKDPDDAAIEAFIERTVGDTEQALRNCLDGARNDGLLSPGAATGAAAPN